MGAIERNLEPTPSVSVHSRLPGPEWDRGEFVFSLPERLVFRPEEIAVLVTNACLSSPRAAVYELPLPAAPEMDIDEIARLQPLTVVARGIASIRKGKLPEPEWDL